MLGAPVNPPGDIQRVSRLGQDVVLFHWTALASFPGPRTTEGGSDGDGDGPRVRDGDRLGRGRGERGVRGEDLLLLLRGVPPAVCGRAGAVRGLSGRAGQADSRCLLKLMSARKPPWSLASSLGTSFWLVRAG